MLDLQTTEIQEDVLPVDSVLEKMTRALRGETDVDPLEDLEPQEWAMDPVARTTEMTERVTERLDPEPQFDLFTTKKEQKESWKTFEEQDPGSPAAFRAAEEASKATRWFKQDNGKIPIEKMVSVPGFGYVKPDAAKALKAMIRSARKDGIDLTGGAYRTYDEQVDLKEQKPDLAATPGTSNHGWGTAIDVNGLDYGTPAYNWLMKNGKRFGWENPEWAVQGGSKEEPWHWEYIGGGSDVPRSRSKTVTKTVRRKVESESNVTDLQAIRNPMVFMPMVFGSVLGEVRDTHTYEKPQDFDEHQAAKGLKLAPKPLRKFFQEAADKYGVPARLLAYVAKQESGFDKNAVSEAGAQGVMQVMPLHGMKNPFNARQNILKGAEILASYINAAEQHHLSKNYGVLRLGLAMYNAGPNNTDEVLISRMSIYSDPILNGFYRKAA